MVSSDIQVTPLPKPHFVISAITKADGSYLKVLVVCDR